MLIRSGGLTGEIYLYNVLYHLESEAKDIRNVWIFWCGGGGDRVDVVTTNYLRGLILLVDWIIFQDISDLTNGNQINNNPLPSISQNYRDLPRPPPLHRL